MNEADRKAIMKNARLALSAGPPSRAKLPMVNRAWEKDLGCEALAVDPDNIEARQAVDARKGLRGVSYDPDGIPHFTSRRNYEAYVKSEGCHFRGKHYPKKNRLGKIVLLPSG